MDDSGYRKDRQVEKRGEVVICEAVSHRSLPATALISHGVGFTPIDSDEDEVQRRR